MKHAITKMQGAGNDFLFFDARKPEFVTDLLAFSQCSTRAQLVKKLCHRQFGVGADGFVFIESSKNYDFKWDFYNADGSLAEMCGNAARCAALWAFKNKLCTEHLIFETLSGTIKASIEDPNHVRLWMTPAKELKFSKSLRIDNQNLNYDFINSGVPHVVLTLDNITTSDALKTLCSQIRNNDQFSPKGTNVTLIKKVSPKVIESVSYERGVENFTMACGTGAVAAALSHHHRYSESLKIEVRVPGGILNVNLSENRPQLIGPAHFIMNLKLL